MRSGRPKPPNIKPPGPSSEADTPLAYKLVSSIEKVSEKFTARQRALADYICRNPESLAFSGITELAAQAGVSQATIVRFARLLGYDGYADMVRQTQQELQAELGTVGRFRLLHRVQEAPDRQEASSFERVVTQEMENLSRLIRNVRTDEFYYCVDLMERADRIYLIGCMGDAVLATFFFNMLSKVHTNVRLITAEDPVTPVLYNQLGKSSLVFAVAFPRYPRLTVKLGKMAPQHGAALVSITDAPLFPLVPESTLSFFLPVGISSFVDAYVSPIALINALVTEFSERHPERTHQNLVDYDARVSDADVFMSLRRRGNGPDG